MLPLLLAALPAASGPLHLRPGRYAARRLVCAAVGGDAPRYDGRRLTLAGRPVAAASVHVHGPEGFTIGRRGRGGRTFSYCRPDELPR